MVVVAVSGCYNFGDCLKGHLGLIAVCTCCHYKIITNISNNYFNICLDFCLAEVAVLQKGSCVLATILF